MTPRDRPPQVVGLAAAVGLTLTVAALGLLHSLLWWSLAPLTTWLALAFCRGLSLEQVFQVLDRSSYETGATGPADMSDGTG